MHLFTTTLFPRLPPQYLRSCAGRFALALSLLLIPGNLLADRGPVLFRQGTQALQKGQYYRATQLLQKALKTLSHWGIAHLELARAMQFNGDPAKTIERHLAEATKKLPRNPRVQLFAAQFYEAQGHPAKALPYYLRALKLNHFAPTACVRSSALLLANNKGSLAIPCLTRLQSRRPIPSQTHLFLARAHQQAGQWEAAAKQWSKALAQRPRSLTRLRKVMAFYQEHTKRQPPAIKRRWQQTSHRLQRRMRKLLPRKKYRSLRPLLPSKH